MKRFFDRSSAAPATGGAAIEVSPTLIEPAARIWIDEIVFSDNSEIKLKKDDVLVIVGPNNCGKSATLRAIDNAFHFVKSESPVVKSVRLEREGDLNALYRWLKRHTTLLPNSIGRLHYMGLKANVDARGVETHWKSESDFSHEIGPLFYQFLSTEERLKAANAPSSVALTKSAPQHPIHALQLDEQLEASISRAFRKAFGQDVVLQHGGGSEVPILVGERPQKEGLEDRVSLSYMRKLERLLRIEKQGDGMRSFLGILLFTMSGAETLVLIDEPEAFLHPPQARHLGSLLVSPATQGRQLILATHSSDLLKGFLDQDARRARVVRIRRVGEVNAAKVLNNDRIREIWSDPLLRHSNILDGLFHDRVVVCEADADCLFYSTIAKALEDEKADGERSPDVLFTHCGGKDRLPFVVRWLRELDVPVSVIADFDVLNDEQPLRSIVEAAGGEWASIANQWSQVKQSIDGRGTEIKVDELKDAIKAALNEITGSRLSENTAEKIRAALRRSSPWALAKEGGIAYVPRGQASEICESLLGNLKRLGIHVVPVGELECFVKRVGRKGRRWAAEALKIPLTDPVFDDAKSFVREIFPYDRTAPIAAQLVEPS